MISGDYSEEWAAVVAAERLYYEAVVAIPNASYDDVYRRALGDVESRHIVLRMLTRSPLKSVVSVMPVLCEVLLETPSEAEAETIERIILRLPRSELIGYLDNLPGVVAEDPGDNSFRRRRLEKLLQESAVAEAESLASPGDSGLTACWYGDLRYCDSSPESSSATAE
jgi:hypothetical protein